MKTKKGFTVIELVAVVGILMFLSGIVLIFSGFTFDTSQGEHTGYVTAVQKTGILAKTYDAYIKTSTQSSQEDKYCVTDEVVAEQLKDAQESRENVTIIFGHGHWIPIFSCNEGVTDIIVGVKK